MQQEHDGDTNFNNNNNNNNNNPYLILFSTYIDP